MMRENLVVVMVASYVTILLVIYLNYGILFQFTPGVFFIALLPFTLILGRTSNLIRDLTPFMILLLSYEALQGLAGAIASGPVLELVNPHVTSFNFASTIQTAFHSEEVTDVATLLYGLHFPLVIISAALLWYTNKPLYK
jgi:hypothetical protein